MNYVHVVVLCVLLRCCESQNLTAQTTPQFIQNLGYPTETHEVTTEDGYILQIHRIPCVTTVPSKGPVLLVHGLMGSSIDWVITGRNQALGLMLADAGYDVWLANCRGNKYSSKHTSFNPLKSGFWDFSFHEIGYYDIPCIIDYILLKTNKPSLNYIGHSQGTTVFFAMCATRPEYNAKCKQMFAFAPAVQLKNMNFTLAQTCAKYVEAINTLFLTIGQHPIHSVLNIPGTSTTKPAPQFSLVIDVDPTNIDPINVPMIQLYGTQPASSKQFIHFCQMIKTGIFKQFDYGCTKNLRYYRSFVAPKYDMSRITCPIYVYYGATDKICVDQDVIAFSETLPNLKSCKPVPYPKCSHLDFIFANHKDFHTQIIDIMNS